MTATLLAIGAGAVLGFALGLCVGRSQRGRLAFVAHFLGEEVEAVHGADLDADVAAERALRLSGDTPAVPDLDPEPWVSSGYRPPGDVVELVDSARLAEMREQADQVRAYEAVRLCNNCGKHAVFVWESDGVPFAACNFCVSLWFEDGLPDHVIRVDLPAFDPALLASSEEGKAWADRIRSQFGDDALNDWADAVHVDDDVPSLPRSLPGNGGNQ